MKKTISIPLLFLSLLPSVMAVGEDFFSVTSNLLDLIMSYEQVSSFIIIFIFFVAVFTIAARKTSDLLGWGDKAGNAVIALAIALSLGGTFALWNFLDRGAALFSSEAGRFFALFALAIVGLMIGYFFYKKREGDSKGFTFLLIAGVILATYYLIDAIFPDFVDEIGSAGGLVSFVVFVAWAVLVLGLAIWVWNHLVSPLLGLKAKEALSDADFAKTKKYHEQEGEVGALKERIGEAKKARKNERRTRRSIRNLDPELKEVADILSDLQKAVATKDHREISGKWKIREKQVKRLEKLKVRIGGYAGIISKILAETTALGINAAEKTKLEAFEGKLLTNVRELETRISTIANQIKKIDKTTVAANPLWTSISKAVKEASNKMALIHRDSMGALALEDKVRRDLKLH